MKIKKVQAKADQVLEVGFPSNKILEEYLGPGSKGEQQCCNCACFALLPILDFYCQVY